ncbi:MAG: dihydroorotate dehydrogenase [Acidimicrobiaceae bacterium]|nr:dihydroorotate dehydrogenase [Ilumatobacter sp.]MCB9379929.1 dihydroorotate dehydrogenase [Acidimicrobiaceae bacterium]MCO5331074.1 dihydroorotate dehydrogenase [Ilumatobacteraceae bacterium]
MAATVTLGSVTLAAPVMTASGTAGHGAELAPYMDLAELGAVVVKSLAAYEWKGNPAPRVHPAGVGMINAVGLQGPGVEHWLEHELPALATTGARVVASIWGRSVEDYAAAAAQLAAAPPSVVAVEVNLSCPNLEGRKGIFAHDAVLSAEVIAATAACGRPRWAKLSPNTDRVVDVAAAVQGAGAEAVTLINTLLGMVLDPATGLPVLGAGGGGYSGRAVHPVAVRAVFDVHAALPELPIIGTGGVASGWDAAELMLAGASAVQVGTATFADPKAPLTVLHELLAWCAHRGLTPSALTGLAHRGGLARR